MKLTIALTALLSSLPETDAFSFVPTHMAKSRYLTQEGVVHHPTRGNVGRRRIKAWHNLELEPWCALKMSAVEDAIFTKANGVNGVNGVNGLNGISTEELLEAAAKAAEETTARAKFDAMAGDMRDEAMRYLSTFKGESGASIVYSKLLEHGVTTVNGYSGGAVLPLLDQFHHEHPRHPEAAPIRWITNSNESSAGHVAEGIAKSSTEADGRPAAGVVVATSGPAVTNLITPLQDAMCDGVPMVVLCGQAATFAPPDAFQCAPAVDITTPCTKWSYQMKSAAELPFVMDYAFHVARQGRPGPVFIDLPKDLQTQTVTDELIQDYVEEELQFGDHKAEHTKDGKPHLVRLQALHDSKTNAHHVAVHVGNAEEGLPFFIGADRLEPVPISKADRYNGVDAYRWDHSPSNKIYTSETKKNGSSFSSQTMEDLMTVIQQAKKPVILAGNGCNAASEELKHFAEKLQIPVTTTLLALGCFDERHPLALNMLGMHGHATPNFMIQESDLIINVGSRFDDRITGKMDEFAPEAKKAAKEGRGGIIHVDIRKSEMDKQLEPDYFVHSTGKRFLQEVNAYLDRDEHVNGNSVNGDGAPKTRAITKPWLTRMKMLQTEHPVKVPKYPSQTFTNSETNESITKTTMSAQHVISTLDKLICQANLSDDCIFTTGVGIHQMVAAQFITWTKPRQMLSSGSLGTMGVALGYCIGAKLANGHKICIAIDGDGSFNMTFTELKTVAEQKIPIKILILDNESQMMVEYWQKLFCDKRYIATKNQKNPEYTKLADAFGIKGLYADSVEDLEDKMKEFLFADVDEPVLLHVKIERTPCLPMVAPGSALNDMIMEDIGYEEMDKSAAPS